MSATGGRRNVQTKQFRELFDALPEHVQAIARNAFRTFLDNPDHPGLSRHRLKTTHRGQLWHRSYAVSITMRYRAIYAELEDRNEWYWIGSHSDYNNFTRSSRK